MEKSERTFEYTYSSKQQDEINNILKKYTPKEADKMEQLRQLDRCATRKGSTISILLGGISSLILGVGMCCSMIWTAYFTIGIVIGVVGLAGVAAAFPLYNFITKKERERIAPQLIALSNELLK